MTTRRIFLKMNLAAYIALATGTRSLASPGAVEPNVDFLFVESDKETAIERVQPYAKVVRFQADPMELWTEHCLPAIEHGKPVFAGITAGFVAFSLSEISRDYGYTLDESTKLASVAPMSVVGIGNPGAGTLDSLELNSPDYMRWVLRPNGINFRGGR